MSDSHGPKRARIDEQSGNEKVNALQYDKPIHYDVTVVVETKPFYVEKNHLARHTHKFDRMFNGEFKEQYQDVVELPEISAESFQTFLECTDGGLALTDENIAGVAHLVDIWDAPVVKKQCVHWLMNHSKLTVLQKFDIAWRYNISEVKKSTISEMTLANLEEVMPNDEYDNETHRLLFLRSMTFASAEGVAIQANDARPPVTPVVQQGIQPGNVQLPQELQRYVQFLALIQGHHQRGDLHQHPQLLQQLIQLEQEMIQHLPGQQLRPNQQQLIQHQPPQQP